MCGLTIKKFLDHKHKITEKTFWFFGENRTLIHSTKLHFGPYFGFSVQLLREIIKPIVFSIEMPQ